MRRQCEWCGASLQGMRRHARFCSPTHRVAAHRRAFRDEAERLLIEQTKAVLDGDAEALAEIQRRAERLFNRKQ